MKLVKLKSTTGKDNFINPEHVAVVAAHGTLLNTTLVILATGVALEFSQSMDEVLAKLGQKDPEIF